MRKRWSRVAGVAALVATTGAAAAAFQIDPHVVTQVSTAATGLWVPAPTTGEIVRVDAGSGAVTARVVVGAVGDEFEIAERDAGVVVVDHTDGGVVLVDPALHEVIRSVRTVPSSRVDIGPEAIVVASDTEAGVVDLDVTTAGAIEVAGPIRSLAADGTGAVVENGDEQISIDGAGNVTSVRESEGAVVRVSGELMVLDGLIVRDRDGEDRGCFRLPVLTPEHLVGTEEDWIVAVDGSTVYVADIGDRRCGAVTLGADVGALGRPVVAGGRVFVPEVAAGVIHIVEPWRKTVRSVTALAPSDLRMRSRGEFVVAYDTQSSVAALLDADGVVRFIDTSSSGRGINAVVGELGSAAVLGEDADAPGVALADGVGGSDGTPVIDAARLAITLRNPAEPVDESPPDDDGLVANFSFSATTVVVGEAVRFVDDSSGNPDSWVWDFGDGTGAEGPEVEKAWDEAGTFAVTLRIGRGDEVSEISLAITVVPTEVPLPPAADFVFSSTVVNVGDVVVFEDRSDGAINRWRWDFGDGTTATAPNVTKVWGTPGRYTVQLTVANEQGSDSASVVIEVVEGLRPPVAVITSEGTEVDLGAPLTFTGISSTDPARLSWDFGDGESSTGEEVVHVFLDEGTFTVTLTATNDAGESRAQIDVQVRPPTLPPIAIIATLPTVIEAGDVISLASLSSNSPDTEDWSFGDGSSSVGQIVTHAWAKEGTYLLTLVASNAAGVSTVTEVVQVVAELPTPNARIGDFNASPWVGEATVFFDASDDATSWLWDFGDGVTSTAPNPLHTFTSVGQKTVTLTVSNRNGSDSASVVVEPRLEPIAAFLVSSTAIRAGQAVTFTDDSVNAVSWFWDFGDLSPLSGVQNPVHVYADTGTYGVVLTVENSTGDRSTVGPLVITVDPALPLLSGIIKVPIDTGSITTLSTATFGAQAAAASGPIDRYEIDFGDGSAIASGVSARFSHVYSASGSYTVRMRAHGPLDDWSPWVSRTFAVVDPAAPSIAIADWSTPSLVGPVALSGTTLIGSGPVNAWRWQINRGASVWNYTGQNIIHVFPAAGDYRISLVAEGPVAAASAVPRVITISVPPPPDIVSLVANPSPVTEGVTVSFTPGVTGSVTTWEWDYEGGGTAFLTGGPTGSHIFNTPGVQQVFLRVTGPFGGTDVMSVSLTVTARPAPSAPGPVGTITTGTQVTLTSTDAAGLAGLRWDWALSNGTTLAVYPNNGPSVTHTFNAAGSWTIAVTATDLNGVAVTAFSFMTVEDPIPLEASFAPPVITGLGAAFVGASTGPAPDSWSWAFGDGGVSSLQSPTHTYAASGNYTVTLVVGSGLESDDFTRVVTIP